jgi:hypothetical protein
MFPIVSSVIFVEFIRDGGSLWAEYVSTDNREYRLIFPINRRFELGEVERLGYLPPVFGRVIRIYNDGIRVGSDLEGVTESTWREARELLESMRPYIDDGKLFERKWFEQMLYVADHMGALPPDVASRGRTFQFSDLPVQSESSISTESFGES